MSQKTLKKEDLQQFTGTEVWHRHGLVRNVLYTDGAKHVAETGGAYWLLDEIALLQSHFAVKDVEFQVWNLTVYPGNSARLTCSDGDANLQFTKNIEFTDFPLDTIRFYFTGDVILLPSEY